MRQGRTRPAVARGPAGNLHGAHRQLARHARIEQSRRHHLSHWVLDMAFGEDQCMVRENNAAPNFAILRRICPNLLKPDTTTKAGIKNRRIEADASDTRRAAVLRF